MVTEKNPVVKTGSGKVMGETREGVAIFRGIPYGGDCGPGRRFMAPVPAESWEGVRDCTKNGPIAVQLEESVAASAAFREYFGGGHPELQGVLEEEQGENCLVLNVLTPDLTGKRPVLFYIHGGGFTTNSGSIATGGDRLVREQNLVLVSVNHRLNAFGFLYLGDLDPKYMDSGNAGMLDLILALKWVQRNIAAFGGDPDRVTIMGESGGGMKVSHLLAMGEAKGLFRQAIVESGSRPVGLYTREAATQDALAFLKRAGVWPDELDKLQTLPVEKLREAIGFGLSGYSPVADGIHLMPNDTGDFHVYPSAKGIPLMVGSSAEEMAAFLPPETFSIDWDHLADALTQPSREESAPLTLQQAEEAVRLLRDADPDAAADHIYQRAVSMRSFLGGGAHRQAEAMAKESGAPVYLYTITAGSPYRDTHVTTKRYAWHTADLPLQFGIVAHPEQEALSKVYRQLWGSFVRTGVPSTEGISWPVYTLDKKETLVFADQGCTVAENPGGEIYAFFDQLENE